MASNRFLMLTIVAMFLPAVAMATEFIVGDSSGWTINYDYQAWAKDKVFHVGDTLVFQYPQGADNVFKVNGTAFTNCDIPPPDQALTTGNDTIVLATPGRKWYICGVADYCSNYGQKLAIYVYPNGLEPAPGPSIFSPPVPTESWAPAPAPFNILPFPWAPAPSSPSVPTTPSTPTEPWAPAPFLPFPWAPISAPLLPPFALPYPWGPVPDPYFPFPPAPSSPSEPTKRATTEPWTPAPAPTLPFPFPPFLPFPWAPAPSSPSVPTTPATPTDEPCAPAPSPYPWN